MEQNKMLPIVFTEFICYLFLRKDSNDLIITPTSVFSNRGIVR